MALFVPDSEIYLLKNIPFTPDYRNTGLFANKESQGAIMQTRAFYHAQNCTYVRETGRIRLEIPIAQAWQCNYIMYRNTNFYNKWFYAFVTAVNYVNNETSEFTFQLDIMQTFLFDYTEKPCFIERQHTPSDPLGGNILPEGIDIGELIEGWHDTLPVTKNNFYVLATFDKQLNNYNGGIQNNIYSGLCINEFSTAAEVTTFINSATSANKLSGIVGIFQAINAGTTQTINITLDRSKMFGGYVPVNNKLYSYPYCFLQVFDNNGGMANFRWEYFAGTFGQVSFTINTTPGINSQMCIYPNNYKGVSGYNPLERMIIENSCLCSWNGDTYKANLAQTIGKYTVLAEAAVNTLGAMNKESTGNFSTDLAKNTGFNIMEEVKNKGLWGAAGASIEHFFTNPVQTLVGSAKSDLQAVTQATGIDQALNTFKTDVLTTIRDTLKSIQMPDSMSRQAQNPGGSTDYLYMIGQKAPKFIQRTIGAYYAKIIDDYFTMYGYQINRVFQPNRRARTRFTYIKTAGAIIEAEFPAIIAQAIENIYNNGICFWWITGTGQNTLESVGTYTNNRPIA